MAGEAAPPVVGQALTEPGQPLDEGVRAFMEPRLGRDFATVPATGTPASGVEIGPTDDPYERQARATARGIETAQPEHSASAADLSNVRVHSGGRASESARAVNARAYTVGEHVVMDDAFYAPETPAGRELLAHELVHTLQQRGMRAGRGQRMQRAISDQDLPRTPADQVMRDETYIDNNIDRIEFYAAELAIIFYTDGAQVRLGLVPDQLEAPFVGVNYRTPRSDIARVQTDQPAQVGFLPNIRSARPAPGTSSEQFLRQFSRTTGFVRHSSGRIVPQEVNSVTAPRLCQTLRNAEAEYVRRTDELARGMVQFLQVMEIALLIYGFLEGLASAGARGAAAEGGAAAGAGAAAARAQSTLTSFFLRLLRLGTTETITVEGVGFGGVRAAMRGTEMVVTRGSIVNIARVAGNGRMIHAAFEQAAIQAARQAGATTVRVSMETVVNTSWRAYLEAQGYAPTIVETATGFANVLSKVFTL
jgi:hypothetical protein